MTIGTDSEVGEVRLREPCDAMSACSSGIQLLTPGRGSPKTHIERSLDNLRFDLQERNATRANPRAARKRKSEKIGTEFMGRSAKNPRGADIRLGRTSAGS